MDFTAGFINNLKRSLSLAGTCGGAENNAAGGADSREYDRHKEYQGFKDYKEYKEDQYDKLAEILRQSLDMALVYKILNREV